MRVSLKIISAGSAETLREVAFETAQGIPPGTSNHREHDEHEGDCRQFQHTGSAGITASGDTDGEGAGSRNESHREQDGKKDPHLLRQPAGNGVHAQGLLGVG